MDIVRIFWIAVIGSAILGMLALLVIAYAMARMASQDPPSPHGEWEQDA